jgi:thymidine kinase
MFLMLWKNRSGIGIMGEGRDLPNLPRGSRHEREIHTNKQSETPFDSLTNSDSSNSPISAFPHTGMTYETSHRSKFHRGHIELICGSMFSGKTEELIRRLNRARIAKLNVGIFKPAMETRYSRDCVVSHDNSSVDSIPVHCATEIPELCGDCDVVGVDEVQFFDSGIIEVVRGMANQGKRVILAGLDMDFEGNPFEPVPQLMAISEHVTKVHAICMKCGDLAGFSLRLNLAKERVMLGEKDSYEARCRHCFHVNP